MADYVTLMGAEDVRSAGFQMARAAEQMQNAAGEISGALRRHEQFLTNWLHDLHAVLEGAKSND